MEYFIVGMVVGYILYPATMVFNKSFANAWNEYKGCKGNCNQGRCVCDCKEKQNGIS